jgi:hypothetical protein
MKISRELSDKIQNEINEFVFAPEILLVKLEEIYDLRKNAGELNVLPIAFDFGHIWALRPDGEIVCFPYEQPAEIEVIGEDQKRFLNMRRGVYLRASKTYPELHELLPIRPADARICESCNGTGREPINEALGYEEERIVCLCCGLGWLPKDENYEITIDQKVDKK